MQKLLLYSYSMYVEAFQGDLLNFELNSDLNRMLDLMTFPNERLKCDKIESTSSVESTLLP